MPDPRPLLPWWAAMLVAVLAGFVTDAAYPELAIWPLVFVGIALALIAQIGRSVGGAFLIAYVYGATFYLLHVEWTSRYLGPVPWLALSLFEALFVGVGGIAITLGYRWVPRAWPGRWARLVALPAVVAALWIGKETVIGSFPYGGFPWARLAVSQSQSPFAETVSWVGFAGLGFAMAWATASAIEWVRVSVERRTLREPLPKAMVGLAPLAAVLVVIGAVPAWPTASAGSTTVASVQGNGPAGYFDERSAGDVLNAQVGATTPLLGRDDIDVLLWPEGSVDDSVNPGTAAARTLDRLTADLDAPLIANTVTVRGDEYFNTSFLWRSGEGITQTYDKRHPVPFGEYIPDRDFYMFFAPDLIGLVQRGYSPGTNPPVFDLGDTIAGLAICFDVIYDEVIHEAARDGAELYLLQTNNADFRGTDENQQQLAFARLRAIETGRWVVNLSTVGRSQVIDPAGRTVDALPSDQPGAMVTEVGLRTGLTPSVVLGGWVDGVISIGGLAALLIAFALGRRRGAFAAASGAEAPGRETSAFDASAPENANRPASAEG
ncbi:apolipoprotein N-acyltransferase [Agromyces larvae]|uniref:Apolipoprotein N-acyltransferase n=1 Tax=Agromyces larvae TaxID=2929802 RepID=A0ABY4C8S9_9MICO|nr:apolipoprotein N-acyltransferase [Agromyces larvae]UOE45085.1 apolipoprotein N-acyltransferase [Agromyces larvae]